MKCFLDANILFSAAYRDGRAARAVALLLELEGCEILTSPYAVEEARRNLDVKAPDRSKVLNQLLRRCTLTGQPSEQQLEQAHSELPDPDDAPILAAARMAGADILVTGDVRHFGHLFDLPDYHPRVMRLADALTLCLKRNEEPASGK